MEIIEIVEKYKNVKQIEHYSKKLLKGINLNSSNNLADLANLAYWLFIIPNDLKASLSICDKVKDIGFNGDYNIWTWIEAICQLGAFINIELGNENEVYMYKKKLASPLTGIDEKKMNFLLRIQQRKLNDIELYNKEILYAIEHGDIQGEMEYRKGQIWKYIYIYVIGGSEVYSDDELLIKICDNITIIRNSLKL